MTFLFASIPTNIVIGCSALFVLGLIGLLSMKGSKKHPGFVLDEKGNLLPVSPPQEKDEKK
jgi:hypothetical protein